ncbi:probable hexosyltransferase MUCI70 [Typha latifolia]|uniref:probable hexosyltransferase MUCI70 n=1 Tax=Typha latifolia TaxID=4733 RepID=UPI003C30C240
MAPYRLGGEPLRSRRARRIPRVSRRICFLWPFSLALLFLIYLSFLRPRFSFHAFHHDHVNGGTFRDEIEQNDWGYSHDTIASNSNASAEVQNMIAEQQGSIDASIFRDKNFNASYKRKEGQVDHSRNTKVKSSKRHVPCEIEFVDSVDDLLEFESFMNFTRFSLDYITEEEVLQGDDLYEPSFGGHQTFEERENSYYAKSQAIHCGFVKGPKEYRSSGFDLDEKDKELMANCFVVVSSCIFGSSDFLRRPTRSKIGTYSKKNVCFMMFVDELTLTKLSSEGQVPDEKGYIGLWRIIVVKNLPYQDMRKTGKVPKFLSHRLFPSARYSIWIDSKLRLHADPMRIIEYFLWRSKAEYAISKHYDRSCVWEEVLQNKRLNKYNHDAIDEQFYFYQSDGLIKYNESDPNVPLPSYVPEGSFIVRAHTPMSNLFSCLWYNEVNRFTSRDQLSFAYTFLKLRRMNSGKPFLLNMFKDCERRALAKLFHHRVESDPPPTIP